MPPHHLRAQSNLSREVSAQITTTLLSHAFISALAKFGAPLAASWMDDDTRFRQFARDLILAPGSQTEQLGLTAPMRAYFDEGKRGYTWPARLSIFSNLAWRLLLLELCASHYVTSSHASQTG